MLPLASAFHQIEILSKRVQLTKNRTTMRTLVFALLCLVGTVLSIKGKANNPVILVPGMIGSKLMARYPKSSNPNWFLAWLNPEILVKERVSTFADLNPVYDPKTHTTHDQDGFEVKVVQGLDGIDTLGHYKDIIQFDYYRNLIERLVKLGYTREKDLHGAPYDFRKAPNEQQKWFSDLKSLIESTYAKNGDRRVMLLSHSMGSPMTMVFLNNQTQEWKDKHVKNFISLSGAFGGSLGALEAFAKDQGGFRSGIPDPIDRKVYWALDTLGVHSPAFYWMMPRASAFGDAVIARLTNETGESSFFVPTVDHYNANNVSSFLGLFGNKDAEGMYADTRPIAEHLQFPGVKTFCLHGAGIKMEATDWALFIDSVFDELTFTMLLPDDGDSDGTLSVRSMRTCERWETENKKGKDRMFYHKEYQGVDHLAIVREEKQVEEIATIIMADQEY